MKPSRLGRDERSARRSRSQGYTTRTESEWENTGHFTGISNPDTGRSDYVRIANRELARRARRTRMDKAPRESAVHARIRRMNERSLLKP